MRVEKITTKEALKEADEFTLKNDHGKGWSRVIFRNDEGEIIGTAGEFTATWFCFDKSGVNMRDVVKARDVVESYNILAGRKTLIVPVMEDSEMFKFYERLGFKTLGQYHLQEKVL